MTENKTSIKLYILLYIAFLIDSFSVIAGKLASNYPTMSFGFIAFYAVDVFALGVFAIMWQQLLKRFPLSVAYSNRPVVTILGVIYGVIFFKDQLSLRAVIGIIVILIGIWLVSAEDIKNPRRC